MQFKNGDVVFEVMVSGRKAKLLELRLKLHRAFDRQPVQMVPIYSLGNAVVRFILYLFVNLKSRITAILIFSRFTTLSRIKIMKNNSDVFEISSEAV